MGVLCKHHQLVLKPAVANAVTTGLGAYCLLVVLLHWNMDSTRIVNSRVITILFSTIAVYVIYCFLKGQDMYVIRMKLHYDASDLNIALRWFCFIFSVALLILLPKIATVTA